MGASSYASYVFFRLTHSSRVSTRRVSGLALLALLGALLASLGGLAGCGSTSSSTGPEKPLVSTDADGTAITIPAQAPQRIVALTPANSEILAAVGVASRVVGVDALSDYPAEMASKTKVSGADGVVSVEKVVALNPDLVLSYGGLTGAQDKQLLQSHITVVDLPIGDIGLVMTNIRLTGQLVHAESQANSVADGMKRRIDAVKAKVASAPKVKTYMEVDDSAPGKPYAFGKGSFGDELIRDAGGANIFAGQDANQGYPQVSDESVIQANPSVIILTEDPQYGGDPKQVAQRPGWANVAAVQSNHVYAVGADVSQRPGPRLADALEQMAKDIHPELY